MGKEVGGGIPQPPALTRSQPWTVGGGSHPSRAGPGFGSSLPARPWHRGPCFQQILRVRPAGLNVLRKGSFLSSGDSQGANLPTFLPVSVRGCFLDTFLSLALPPCRGACLGVFSSSGSPRDQWPQKGCRGRPVRKPAQAGAGNTASPVASQVPIFLSGSWTGSSPGAGTPSLLLPSWEQGARGGRGTVWN